MMIPIGECKDGWFYIIRARNSNLGIYQEKENGFIIRREKFRSIFLFTEYHWETGAPHGTASPIKELFKVQDEILHANEDELLLYLAQQEHQRKNEIEKAVNEDIQHIKETNWDRLIEAIGKAVGLSIEEIKLKTPEEMKQHIGKKPKRSIKYTDALGEEITLDNLGKNTDRILKAYDEYRKSNFS